MDPFNPCVFTLLITDKIFFSYSVSGPTERDIVVATIRAFAFPFALPDQHGLLKYQLRVNNEVRMSAAPLPIETILDEKLAAADHFSQDFFRQPSFRGDLDLKSITGNTAKDLDVISIHDASPAPSFKTQGLDGISSLRSTKLVPDSLTSLKSIKNTSIFDATASMRIPKASFALPVNGSSVVPSIADVKQGPSEVVMDDAAKSDIVEEPKPVIRVQIKATADAPATSKELRRNLLAQPPPSASGKAKRTVQVSTDLNAGAVLSPPHAAVLSFAAVNGLPSASAAPNVVATNSDPIRIVGDSVHGVDLVITEIIHAKLELGKVTDLALLGEITVNVPTIQFSGSDLRFNFNLLNTQNIQNLLLNPKYTKDLGAGHYSVVMQNAVHSNIAIAKYKIDLKVCSKPPLLVLPQWKLSENEARFVAKFKVNHRIIRPDVKVQFLITLNPEQSVLNCVSHEPANTMVYNAAKQKGLWKLPLPNFDGQIAAIFQTSKELVPTPLMISFHVDGSISGLDIECKKTPDSNIEFRSVMKQIKSGTFSAS